MIESIITVYNSTILLLPEHMRILPPLLVFSIIITFYSIFVWLFYNFLAKRDILKLDLNKYNTFEHSGFLKFFAAIFYIIEFIIIVPFVICLWFSVLSILLLLLAKDQPIISIMLISASVVTAIRISAYYKEDLSKDLAKMLPFTLLGIAIITPGFFDVAKTLAKILEIPSLFSNILYYAIFIIAIESILRLFYSIFSATQED